MNDRIVFLGRKSVYISTVDTLMIVITSSRRAVFSFDFCNWIAKIMIKRHANGVSVFSWYTVFFFLTKVIDRCLHTFFFRLSSAIGAAEHDDNTGVLNQGLITHALSLTLAFLYIFRPSPVPVHSTQCLVYSYFQGLTRIWTHSYRYAYVCYVHGSRSLQQQIRAAFSIKKLLQNFHWQSHILCNYQTFARRWTPPLLYTIIKTHQTRLLDTHAVVCAEDNMHN